MSDFGGSGRYNEYKESGRMPEELLEYFKRKARYGMKFQDSGQWSGDISNIRVLQSPEGENTFLMKGDKGYETIGGQKDLFNLVGDQAAQSYLGSLGWEPVTDAQGKRTGFVPGKDFTGSHLGADFRKFDPSTKASNAFVEEFFGVDRTADGSPYYGSIGNQLVGDMQTSWFNSLDPEVQKELGGTTSYDNPEYDLRGRAGNAFRSYNPAGQRKIAQRYMMEQLLGSGQGQGGGGL